MENITMLKQENRKLSRQLKENTGGKSTSPAPSSSASASKVTARDVAALSVEHEMLTQQIEEMKKFIQENEKYTNNDMLRSEESITYKKNSKE